MKNNAAPPQNGVTPHAGVRIETPDIDADNLRACHAPRGRAD